MSEPFELFPGFKTPPNAGEPPKQAIPERAGMEIIQPYDADEDFDCEEYCEHCDNWGFTVCYCGGDFCVCSANGERPCPYC